MSQRCSAAYLVSTTFLRRRFERYIFAVKSRPRVVGLLTPVPVRRDPSTSEGDSMARSFVIFVLLLTFSQEVLASPTGSIAGSVKDPTEAVVPGVKITLTNTATNA